jgi:hypothetical protein
MSVMLDDDLLASYANSFYGYGRYEAPYWFIGLEEGSDGSVEEIQRRLVVWREGGCQELEDAWDYHVRIGAEHLTRERPKLQSTWKQLCRIVLVGTGQPSDTESLRHYQKHHLGRRDGATCLLELLPLPSRNTGEWQYWKASRLSHLASRRAAQQYYAPRRVLHLRQRIAQYRPAVVVFYGATNRTWWTEIAGVPFERVGDAALYSATAQDTLYLITTHPTFRQPAPTAYFEAVGQVVREWNKGHGTPGLRTEI